MKLFLLLDLIVLLSVKFFEGGPCSGIRVLYVILDHLSNELNLEIC